MIRNSTKEGPRGSLWLKYFRPGFYPVASIHSLHTTCTIYERSLPRDHLTVTSVHSDHIQVLRDTRYQKPRINFEPAPTPETCLAFNRDKEGINMCSKTGKICDDDPQPPSTHALPSPTVNIDRSSHLGEPTRDQPRRVLPATSPHSL